MKNKSRAVFIDRDGVVVRSVFRKGDFKVLNLLNAVQLIERIEKGGRK